MMRCPSRLLIVMVALLVSTMGVAADAQAQDLHAQAEETHDGIATTLGPQVGFFGPPTALKVQVSYWHDFSEAFAFYATTGLLFTGEIQIAGDEGLPDAAHASTFGAGFGSGVKITFDLGIDPVELYTRAGVNFSFMTADRLVGYMMGPAAALGVSYEITEGFGLLAEVDTTLGYGQYQGAGNAFAWTMDLLAGACVEW